MSPMHKWLIAWGILSVMAIGGGFEREGWRVLLTGPGGCALLLAIIAVIYYSKSPCPSCAKRWAGQVWDHQRQDGGPDLRYQGKLTPLQSMWRSSELIN